MNFLNKVSVLLTSLLICISSFSQKDYDAVDARILINKSVAQDTDDELIKKLASYKLTDSEKASVSAQGALTLQRYKLAKYMLENGYGNPKLVSHMFGKPFSCGGHKNTSSVSTNVYTYDETVSYIDAFVDLGMVVDVRCVYLLEDEENNEALIAYVSERLSDKDKAGLDQREFYKKFKDESTSVEELQKMLDSTGAVIEDAYIFTAIYRDIDYLKLCVENGCNINYNYGGFTALLKLANSSSIEKIEYLINNGADVCAENYKGKSCYKIAKKSYKKSKSKASEESLEKREKLLEMFKEKSKNC